MSSKPKTHKGSQAVEVRRQPTTAKQHSSILWLPCKSIQTTTPAEEGCPSPPPAARRSLQHAQRAAWLTCTGSASSEKGSEWGEKCSTPTWNLRRCRPCACGEAAGEVPPSAHSASSPPALCLRLKSSFSRWALRGGGWRGRSVCACVGHVLGGWWQEQGGVEEPHPLQCTLHLKAHSHWWLVPPRAHPLPLITLPASPPRHGPCPLPPTTLNRPYTPAPTHRSCSSRALMLAGRPAARNFSTQSSLSRMSCIAGPCTSPPARRNSGQRRAVGFFPTVVPTEVRGCDAKAQHCCAAGRGVAHQYHSSSCLSLSQSQPTCDGRAHLEALHKPRPHLHNSSVRSVLFGCVQLPPSLAALPCKWQAGMPQHA